MTLSDIKLGIAEVLKTAYPEFDIYTDYLEQGFTDRCFFIERIGSQKSEILCFSDIERYEQTHNFSITCFCDDSKTKLDELSDSLYYTLSEITASDVKLRVLSMSHSYSDGALVFLVDYKTITVMESEKIPEMEVLKTDVNKKE